MTTLAVMSRVSVGLGAVAALVLILAARTANALRRRRGAPQGRPGVVARAVGWPEVAGQTNGVRLRWVLLAIVTPLVLYAYVNITKFGSPFGLPLDKQFLVRFDKARAAAQRANTLTGIRFVPTTVLQYLRPDAIRFDRLFPWVTFPGPARVIGSAHFASLDFTSSVTTAMTALFVLWVIGVVVCFRPARPDSLRATALRIPVLAGLVGCVSVLAFGFVANRYMGDFIPALCVGAVIGFHACVRWATRPSTRRVAVRAAVAAVAVLVIWTCFVNLGLALQYQRNYGVGVTEATRAGWIGFQLGVHDRIPGGAPSDVVRAPAIPPVVGPDGQFLVIGDCAGLAWSDGRQWRMVERTPATGRVHLGVRFPTARPGTVEPLVATGTADDAGLVLVRFERGHRIAFEYSPVVNGSVRQHYAGPAQVVKPATTYDVDVVVDPLVPVVNVALDGRTVLDVSLGVNVIGGPPTVGRDPTGALTTTFGGQLRGLATPTPLCTRLTS